MAFCNQGRIDESFGARSTIEIANHLQKEGFDVRAIRPPTVAPKTARLRISVHADHSEKTIDRLATALLVLKDKLILQVQQ